MTRTWRGASYAIAIERGETPRIVVDGREHDGNLLPVPVAGAKHDVTVIVA
jgi:cellobiose phosphorylase